MSDVENIRELQSVVADPVRHDRRRWIVAGLAAAVVAALAVVLWTWDPGTQ